MIELLIFICICWGLTNIISKGKIFEPMRDFLELIPGFSFLANLINCPMCLGFWIGLGVSYYIYSPTQHFLAFDSYFYVADGCVASGIIWVVYCMLEKCKCYDL